jgi:hypothetical protein
MRCMLPTAQTLFSRAIDPHPVCGSWLWCAHGIKRGACGAAILEYASGGSDIYFVFCLRGCEVATAELSSAVEAAAPCSAGGSAIDNMPIMLCWALSGVCAPPVLVKLGWGGGGGREGVRLMRG